jgi:hypothetical protein
MAKSDDNDGHVTRSRGWKVKLELGMKCSSAGWP